MSALAFSYRHAVSHIVSRPRGLHQSIGPIGQLVAPSRRRPESGARAAPRQPRTPATRPPRSGPRGNGASIVAAIASCHSVVGDVRCDAAVGHDLDACGRRAARRSGRQLFSSVFHTPCSVEKTSRARSRDARSRHRLAGRELGLDHEAHLAAMALLLRARPRAGSHRASGAGSARAPSQRAHRRCAARTARASQSPAPKRRRRRSRRRRR